MSLTKEQKKELVMQWKNAAPELQKIKDKELSESVYDWRIVDALLEIGASSGKSLKTSGLVEMQRLFMLLRNKEK
ncbi:MAG: hypothetical protein R6W70_05680 [bacterium]